MADDQNLPDEQLPADAETPTQISMAEGEVRADDLDNLNAADVGSTEAASVNETEGSGAETECEPADVDPLEAEREKLASLPGQWYVIHSYSGHERRVKTNLMQRIQTQNMEDYIFQVEVPMETVTEMTKSNKKRKVERVRVPGYVLVRMEMNEMSWRVVKDTPAVTGFVGDARDPVPLHLDEVVNMFAPMWQAQADKAESEPTIVTAPSITFEVGESVTVVDGPFENMPATVAAVDNSQRRLTLSIMIFERETPLEVTFDQVAKS